MVLGGSLGFGRYASFGYDCLCWVSVFLCLRECFSGYFVCGLMLILIEWVGHWLLGCCFVSPFWLHFYFKFITFGLFGWGLVFLGDFGFALGF